MQGVVSDVLGTHGFILSVTTPCVYDHVLRTESLADDWITLLIKTGNPLWRIPRSNPTVDGPLGPPPRTVFTQEVVDIINRVEASVFTEFGYQRRAAPFELGADKPHREG